MVATLTRGLDADSALRGASVYMTPIVLHLALVLSVSRLAAAPGLTSAEDGVVLALATALGAIACGRVIFHLGANELLSWSCLSLKSAAVDKHRVRARSPL